MQVETATTDHDGPGRRNGQPSGKPLHENGVVRRYFAKRTEFYKASPQFARWIDAHAREYDLLHLHALFSFTTTMAARCARRRGVPYVVRPLGTLEAWSLAQRRPWSKTLSLRLIEAPLLRSAAAVHFTSDSEARQAQALGIPVRGVVIPLGVDVPEVPPRRQPSAEFRVLFLSRLDPKKNIEGLLEAVALLHERHPQLRLAVAG
ncbi:MAG: glycosyltransferase, partial [Variovorax sp.]